MTNGLKNTLFSSVSPATFTQLIWHILCLHVQYNAGHAHNFFIGRLYKRADLVSFFTLVLVIVTLFDFVEGAAIFDLMITEWSVISLKNPIASAKWKTNKNVCMYCSSSPIIIIIYHCIHLTIKSGQFRPWTNKHKRWDAK